MINELTDVTLASDAQYSAHVDVSTVSEFFENLLFVKPNHGIKTFVMDDGKGLLMEIDLEHVNSTGDFLEEFRNSDTFNCVNFHIVGDGDVLNDYLPVIKLIADNLNWAAMDETTNELLASI